MTRARRMRTDADATHVRARADTPRESDRRLTVLSVLMVTQGKEWRAHGRLIDGNAARRHDEDTAVVID